jgi:hypothetical protein
MWGNCGVSYLAGWPGLPNLTIGVPCTVSYGPGPGPYPGLPDSSVMCIYMHAKVVRHDLFFLLSPMSTSSPPSPPSEGPGSPGGPSSSLVSSRHIDEVIACLKTIDTSGTGKRKR